MSEDELFCGHICMAAHRMGIYGRFEPEGFRWFDVMANIRIGVESKGEKKEILHAACKSLVKYLSAKP